MTSQHEHHRSALRSKRLYLIYVILIVICVVVDLSIYGICFCTVLCTNCFGPGSAENTHVIPDQSRRSTENTETFSCSRESRDVFRGTFCMISMLLPTLILLFMIHVYRRSYIVQAQLEKLMMSPRLKQLDESSDKMLEQFIMDLIRRTWKYHDQAGRDAVNLDDNSLKVKNVFSVENDNLWTRYIHGYQTVRFSDEKGLLPRSHCFKKGCNSMQNIVSEDNNIVNMFIQEVNENYNLNFHSAKTQTNDSGVSVDTAPSNVRCADTVIDKSSEHNPIMASSFNKESCHKSMAELRMSVLNSKTCDEIHTTTTQHQDMSSNTDSKRVVFTIDTEPCSNSDTSIASRLTTAEASSSTDDNPQAEPIRLEKATRPINNDSQASLCLRSLLNLHKGEAILFHGTKLKNVASIIEHGFQIDRLCAHSLYGKGIYLTDSSQKADQYSDTVVERRDKTLAIILVRVVLGDVGPFEETQTEIFDTVVAGKGKRFAEYVKHKPHQCYPAFVVIYNRSRKEWDQL